MPDLPCPYRRPSRVGFRLGNPSLSLPLIVCSASPSFLPNHPFSQGNGLGLTGGGRAGGGGLGPRGLLDASEGILENI
jgi:hypothetical protein